MSFYIQIGAGGGDLDEISNFKDGFTNFLKKRGVKKDDKILIVEANPLNLDRLKECWKDFKNLKILNLAIVDKRFDDENIKIYYTEDDKPCYQVSSIFKEHLIKHYPNSKILTKTVQSKKINDFLIDETKKKPIEYLAIDTEGLDFDLVMDIDFDIFEIKNISIEFLHLNKKCKKQLIHKLIEKGYSYYGNGFDVRGYDFMFTKKMNFFLKIKTKYFINIF